MGIAAQESEGETGRGMDLEELADSVHIQVRHVLIINAFNRVAHAYASCTSCCTPGSQRLDFDLCVRDFALVFGHLFCVQTDRITSCSLCLWPEKDKGTSGHYTTHFPLPFNTYLPYIYPS